MKISFQTSNFLMKPQKPISFQGKFHEKTKERIFEEIRTELETDRYTISEAKKKRYERNKLIIEKCLNGESRQEIAKEVNLHVGTVNRICEKYNVFNKYQEDKEQTILQMLKDNINRKDIAEQLSVPYYTVHRIAAKNNIKSNENKKKQRNKKILRELKEGKSCVDIGKEYNLHAQTISKIKVKNGLGRTYNWLPKPQLFKYEEIIEQSHLVTQIRQLLKDFKHGERTPEILQQIEETLKVLLENIQEFKTRLEKNNNI